jgi:transcriptional regulator with XRE-family HTH domain
MTAHPIGDGIHDATSSYGLGGLFMNWRSKRGPSPAAIRFGEKLRTRRIMLGMSQTELGAALNVTFQQIQKYERGINSVSASGLEKLAATLGVHIGYFFRGQLPENGQDDSSEVDSVALLATPEGVALCAAFQHIESQAMRNAAIKLLQGMMTQH